MGGVRTERPWQNSLFRRLDGVFGTHTVENMWSSFKRSMANLAPGRIGDLLRIAKNRLKRMQYRPTLAFGFLATSSLAPP